MNTEIIKTELLECEGIIEITKGAFAQCGDAIARIRDKKLYKADYGTFEAYCKKRWGWGRQYAYRLIQASEVKMSPVGDKIKNERVARELLKVPEGEREEVLEKVAKLGPITGPAIRNVIATKKPTQIELDKVGHPIPESLLEDWGRAQGARDLLSKISDVRCAVKEALDGEDNLFCEVTNSTIADLSNAYTSLKCVLPYAVCPTCEGRQKTKCTLCRGRGFISQFRYEQCVPSEIKAMRAKGRK